MEFTKLHAPTLKELFIKELEAKILSGQLAIGQRLPSERELAESMQVSRAVVNSGLSELARKGFIHVKPRSGVYVADYRRYGTVETLLSIMNYNGGQLRREEIRSILELKVVIDSLAVELAIQKLTEEDLIVLRERLDAIKSETGLEKSVDATFNYYHEITMVSGNYLLPIIYSSFRVPIKHLWIRFVRKYSISTVYDSALRIYTALVEKDAKAAVAAVESAVSASINGTREIYED